MNPKINVLLGTKAEMIKAAPVIKELEKRGFSYRLIETGQHGAYLDKLREEFQIREPDVRLGKKTDVDSLFQACKWLLGLIPIIVSRKRVREQVFSASSGICLIHGDTPSTLVGALLAKRAGLQIAHLESGLRSESFLHPFPEEIIRVIVMKLSDVLFAPDEKAVSNLVALKVKGRIEETTTNTGIESLEENIEEVNRASGPVIATLHRVENLHRKKRLKGFLKLLEQITQKGQQVLFVLHQPTQEILHKQGLIKKLEEMGIKTVPLMPYKEFIKKLASAPYVITDGGSIQEETAHMGIPCLLWRGKTERQNGLGQNVVISNYDKKTSEAFLNDFENHRTEIRREHSNPSSQVVDVLEEAMKV